ncbi:helix-turn-helix domain-containing protein [Streptomyces sp. NPDC021020]|uniref:helix-turn-helix domain-containing protein n=1 Tax=Streptomyces sp. NPDC021020 TaxID=3365109 RepID=UPI0037A0A64A
MERFEGGQKNAEIAAALRISVRSIERWPRAWRESGEVGLLPKGSPGRPGGSAKPRSPSWSGNWSAALWLTGGRTSDGPWRGSRR